MTKQVIVVNKGLNMSKGKMAAQVSHASMAFLTSQFLDKNSPNRTEVIINGQRNFILNIPISEEVNEWIMNSFTKVILEVKNETQLNNFVEKIKSAGFIENKDFFCIRDNCRTELIPDETGTRFTCIGFVPMASEKIDPYTKRLQLYKE